MTVGSLFALALVAARPAPAHAQAAVLAGDVRNGRAGPVALEGDIAVVGMPGREGGGAPGEVVVWQRMGAIWTIAQRIPSAAGAGVNANFGASVALLGDTLVVGAPGLRDGGVLRGAAYVYRRTDVWELMPGALDRPAGDLVGFGASVAVNDSWIVVGAPSSDSFDSPGTVVVFDRTGVASPVLLTAEAPRTGLGTSVAVAEDVVLAGEPALATAAAFEFAGTWMRAATLAAPGGGSGSRFGTSVAMVGVGGTQRALIGAPQWEGRGAVFGFDRSAEAWPVTGGVAVVIPAIGTSDALGTAVSLDAAGALAVVGAPLAELDPGDETLRDSGAVHVLSRSGATWEHVATLRSGAPEAMARLGSHVAMSANTLAAGAPNAPASTFEGHVAVFRVPDPPGAACTAGDTCGSGRCVGERCCSGACDGECASCDDTGACVPGRESLSCTAACGVPGRAGVCAEGQCSAMSEPCPDAGTGELDAAGTTTADAGPRYRVSGCKCCGGPAPAPTWVTMVGAVTLASSLLRRRARWAR